MPRGQDGQATVELLGILPALVVLGLAAWQLVLVGHTGWLAADAARVAARADLVDEDPARAARSALPNRLEDGLDVTRSAAGATRVSVPVPLLDPVRRGPVSLSAAASLRTVR